MPFAVTRKSIHGPPHGPPRPADPADGEMPEEAAGCLDRPQPIFPKKVEVEVVEVIRSRGRSVQISQLWLRS